MRIAIIGAGISGLGAAWLLKDCHEITVFEKETRIGGHTNTATVDYDGSEIKVDTGFIVYNELNYPNLTALFDKLGVATRASDMSFAFSRPGTSQEWSGVNFDTIFTWRRNALSASFLAMLKDVVNFNQRCLADLEAGYTDDMSLGDYLEWRGFGPAFRDHYLLPMGSAIWSTSAADMLSFPANSFIRFFVNHRLINKKTDRPQWRTVVGGSNSYLAPLTREFQDRIITGADIAGVRREKSGATIRMRDGTEHEFDEVIFACHSDEALGLIEDKSLQEEALLGAIKYAPNRAFLHRDRRLMPTRKKAWASWNYICDEEDGDEAASTCVTYWMNRLQGIEQDKPIFVTLNPRREPDPHLTFDKIDYMHPQFDTGALIAQKNLGAIQGVNRTWFCGAWTGYGFHEDGLASGLEIAERLGGRRPWGKSEGVAPETFVPIAAD